jgi:hypothetical protein
MPIYRAQAIQRILILPAIRGRHLGFRRQRTRRRWGCRCCGHRRRRCGWRGAEGAAAVGQVVLGELLVARSLMVPVALPRSGLVGAWTALTASVLGHRLQFGTYHRAR